MYNVWEGSRVLKISPRVHQHLKVAVSVGMINLRGLVSSSNVSCSPLQVSFNGFREWTESSSLGRSL
jgi:hypothetical protein